jgi:hypothetical protein
MVNLLISVILSGLAVTFAIEFLYLGLQLILNKEKVYSFLSLPLSFGALTCFYTISLRFVVAVPAISFIVLFINKYINKPMVLATPRRLPTL